MLHHIHRWCRTRQMHTQCAGYFHRLRSECDPWEFSKLDNQQKIENLNRKIICFKSYSFLTWEQLHNVCFINRPWETSDLNHFTFIGL